MALAWLLSLALQADLETWVSRLAVPESRAGALDRLLHADPAALRQVPGLDASILEGAELRARLAPSYAPPRRISFDGREEDLFRLLARLEAASGLVFHLSALPVGLRAAPRLVDVPVWEALSELGKAASFTIVNTDGRQIHLGPLAPGARPRAFHGPFMIDLDRISRRDRVGFDKTATDFWLRLALWWEPSVHPLGVDAVADLRAAVDDQGRSLRRAAGPAAVRPVTQALGHGSATIEGLAAPAPDARSLSVEGDLVLRFPARVQEAVLQGSGTAVFDGLRLKAELTEPAAGGVLVAVTLDFDDPARAAAYRPAVTDLIFETLAPWRGLGPSLIAGASEGGRRHWQIRAVQLPRGDLIRFRIRVPEGEVRLPLPFRFEKVPLR